MRKYEKTNVVRGLKINHIISQFTTYNFRYLSGIKVYKMTIPYNDVIDYYHDLSRQKLFVRKTTEEMTSLTNFNLLKNAQTTKYLIVCRCRRVCTLFVAVRPFNIKKQV